MMSGGGAVLSVSAGGVAPPSAPPPGPPPPTTTVALTAPAQLQPPDGSVFNTYPRTTNFSWQAVTGAAKYTIEIQFSVPPSQSFNPLTEVTVSGTSYMYEFLGAQPGRWRVSAVDANNNVGPASPWWGFTYTR